MRAATSTTGSPPESKSLPLKRVKPIKRDAPKSDDHTSDGSGHRRKIQVVKQPTPPANTNAADQNTTSTPPERTEHAPPAGSNLRGPTPEEVEADPLVRSVLDVFEGEIKRIHPKNK